MFGAVHDALGFNMQQIIPSHQLSQQSFSGPGILNQQGVVQPSFSGTRADESRNLFTTISGGLDDAYGLLD
ncbi:hypothetical protein HDU97_009145, partial [Phlyctochytrium planicorne]